MRKTISHTRGFTLIELIVTISIISILAAVVLSTISGGLEKARFAKTQDELDNAAAAISLMADDTGKHPGGDNAILCDYNNTEIELSDCEAGLLCNDGTFSATNWRGPYLTPDADPWRDPWGNRYYYDPDYVCRTGVRGCENVPDGMFVRALESHGPNKDWKYEDGDNVVSILCVVECTEEITYNCV